MILNVRYCNGKVVGIAVPDANASNISSFVDSKQLPGFCIIRGGDITLCVPIMQLQSFDFQNDQPNDESDDGPCDGPWVGKLPF